MNIRNSHTNWGVVSIAVHWVVAVAVIGLFAVGLYMVELDYYDSMYRTAPFVHKSIGILLFLLMVFRLLWRLVNTTPTPLESHKRWEQKAAHWMHNGLYILLFILMISGYLISTADGRGISVFGWFEVPSILSGIDNQEDIAGGVHEILAYILIAFVVVHAVGALKHHFIDKDRTLTRMLGQTSSDK